MGRKLTFVEKAAVAVMRVITGDKLQLPMNNDSSPGATLCIYSGLCVKNYRLCS